MLLLFTLLFLATSTTVFTAPAPVDSSTLDGKVIFGYQGWFMTPDGGGDVGYRHWSKDPNSMNPKTVNVDIWPDMTEYPADSFQSTDLVLPGSQAAPVFSSLNPGVMDLHFRWLYNYSLDGVFLQRFLGEVQDSRFFAIRNNVTTNMRAAAEKYNRTFAIMYDVTGMTDDGLLTNIQNDWKYLTGTLQVTQSPQYQKHNGKPVLTIWGLGFTHINISSAVALQVVSYFQSQGYYVIGGVPFAWRTSNQDSRPDFTSVYQQFDALSPWAVGRFDDSGVKSAFEVRVVDKTVSYARGQYYAPVLFPGFSWANMNAPNATLNQIPRLAGKFFTDQADGLVNTLLAKKTFLYLAMFDEMDEGTAFFKAAPNKNQVPVDPSFVTLDIDGTDLPSDYYLQLASNVTANFKKVSSFTSKTLLRA